MKPIYFLFLLIILFSCNGEISDAKYRNENYVFYQEEGNAGEWQLIDPLLELKPHKSNSTYFFPNGNKYAELEVIDSFPNRIIKYFDKVNGKLTRTSYYKSDNLIHEIYVEGYYRQYYSSLGALQSEGNIKNRLIQGQWKYYAKDGITLEQIAQYENDTTNGLQKFFYENGTLKEVNYQKKGLLHGHLKAYYENGVLKTSKKYWNDHIIDTNKVFDEKGKLKMVQIFRLDTISLKTKFVQFNYNINEKLDATAYVENDISHIKTYYEDGKIKEIFTKINNKHEGLVTTFHENGIKMMEGIASNGRLNGDFKFFDKSGKLIKTVNYLYGKPIDTITH